MRQVETYLLQRHYDGFLRKGKIRGRFEQRNVSTGRTGLVGEGALLWMCVGAAALAVVGVAISIFVTNR